MGPAGPEFVVKGATICGEVRTPTLSNETCKGACTAHTHTHIHTRTHMHTRTYTRIYTYTHAYTHANTHTNTHAHTRTYMHTHIQTRSHTCVHTRTHAYTRIHTRIPTFSGHHRSVAVPYLGQNAHTAHHTHAHTRKSRPFGTGPAGVGRVSHMKPQNFSFQMNRQHCGVYLAWVITVEGAPSPCTGQDT